MDLGPLPTFALMVAYGIFATTSRLISASVSPATIIFTALVALIISGISAQPATREEMQPNKNVLRDVFNFEVNSIDFFSLTKFLDLSTMGILLMRLAKIQGLRVKLAYYCAIVFMLSMSLSIEIANAQSATSDSLESLVKQLEKMGGETGALKGKFGVGSSAIDSAREDASKGLARSPLGKPDDSDFEELNTRFSFAELILIERYCGGEASKEDLQVLQFMEEFSRVERDYCRRVSEKVLQIGYDVFDGLLKPGVLVNGSIGNDYILGIGDELVVTFEGKKNESITTFVDREGRFSDGALGRIMAAGRSFGDFRSDLQRLVKKTHFGTRVFVSMGSVRLIAIRVTGEVRKPGHHQLTGLSTIFDAIALAGGIKKTGSLRLIQVKRGDRIFWVDAYELIYPRFGGQDFALREGDHILVPPLGHTISVVGDVKRPGIFELSEGQKNISTEDALKFAGGLIRSRGNLLQKLSFDGEGRENRTNLTGSSNFFQDGDIVYIKRKNSSTIGTVSISGHVSNPGDKPLASALTVRDLLLKNNSLKPKPYLLFGVLETTDPSTQSRLFFPINLQEIVEGKKDYRLRDKDNLIVFSHDEIRYLSSDGVLKTISSQLVSSNDTVANGEEQKEDDTAQKLADRIAEKVANQKFGDETKSSAEGKTNDQTEKSPLIRYSCRGLRSLATVVQFTQSLRFASVLQALGGVGRFENVNGRDCPAIFDSHPDLLPFVLEHTVAVNGEIRIPGAYPVVTNTPISSLLAVVGGLSLDADLSKIEISRFAIGQVNREVFDFTKTKMHDVMIGPGDIAKFNPQFKNRDSGPVLLTGEFTRPGLYDLRRGERLSEVIARAGGITDQAYPYGTVFTRERVKRAQQEGFRRAAKELKSAAIFAAGRTAGSPEGIASLLKLTDEVVSTEALGRVVIEADPNVLSVRPELDSVLEPGDRIFMPKRPNSVLVIGDVLNPGALQFIAGTKADAYVNQAGGMRQSADEDRMFLVYPNGVAQPISVSVWNYNPVQVPPGSTLVVPMDPVPLDIFTFAKDMTTLISQLAITAASLAVIGSN
jgi:polysaccharide biosynthesis/export protein